MMKNKISLGCNYAGYDFGAHYIDSQCFDGVLYDMDACDESGNLYEPLQYIPCPRCNTQAWLDNFRSEFIEDGISHGLNGKPFNKIRTVRIPDEIRNSPGLLRKIPRLLRRGYYYGLKNQH
ncbi:hypothetical protein ACGAPV_000741 [Morganella morganii]